MEKDKIVGELLKSASENGLVVTLRAVFGKCVSVSVPFSSAACGARVDDICFSQRANNSLKRAKVFTVREIIDLISSGGLLNIRNLGKKTENEIKTRVLIFGYEMLSEKEKKQFFYDVLERNV